MSFQAGDTFLYPLDQTGKEHLWVIATQPGAVPTHSTKLQTWLDRHSAKMHLPIRHDILKLTAALLRLAGGKLQYLALIKLLYKADREASAVGVCPSPPIATLL